MTDAAGGRLNEVALRVAEWQACGHCDGSCGDCQEDAAKYLREEAKLERVYAELDTLDRDDDAKKFARKHDEAVRIQQIMYDIAGA